MVLSTNMLAFRYGVGFWVACGSRAGNVCMRNGFLAADLLIEIVLEQCTEVSPEGVVVGACALESVLS